jgi:hypothetical protein
MFSFLVAVQVILSIPLKVSLSLQGPSHEVTQWFTEPLSFSFSQGPFSKGQVF